MTQHPRPEVTAPGALDLRLTRIVPARREVVWRLWTESQHLGQWWGPHGFTNPHCSIDARPGGELRIVMRSADGEEYLSVGTVQVVDPPDRLVFTVALMNPDGSRRLENLTTVDLVDRDGATEVTVTVQVLYATPQAKDNLAGMRAGWSESLDKQARTVQDGVPR